MKFYRTPRIKIFFIKYLSLRMEHGFWMAIAIGGLVIATLSAVQQYYSSSSSMPYSEFKIKPVVRDFCIGAFLTAAVYMMIPDSVQELVSQAQNLLPKSSGSTSQDIELQTGPAKF